MAQRSQATFHAVVMLALLVLTLWSGFARVPGGPLSGHIGPEVPVYRVVTRPKAWGGALLGEPDFHGSLYVVMNGEPVRLFTFKNDLLIEFRGKAYYLSTPPQISTT